MRALCTPSTRYFTTFAFPHFWAVAMSWAVEGRAGRPATMTRAGRSVFMEGPSRLWASSMDLRPGAEAEDAEGAAQVGQHRDLLAPVDHAFVQDLGADLHAKVLEILHRAEVDVGRVVPGVRQRLRHRHVALQDVEPVAPVAEVGEGHDSLASHAQ